MTIAQSAALSDWNRLLAAVLRLAPADLKPSDIHLTARALYKQGRLLDDALRYPFARISAEYLLYSRELPRGGSEELAKWLCSSRTFFELGIWNAAENNTGDALTVLSYHPAGLRQMADFKLARSMPGAARPYLGALRCDFWYRREADSLLAAIDRADSTGFTAFFPELRASVPDIDSIGALITLQDVLEKNPDNRMAFEYMVFHYLISCDLGNLAGNIAGFRRMGCTTLPRLVEEAMAVYIHGMGKSCDLHGYEISKATLARMAAGDLLYARAGENKKAALPALSALYGDSYFFYIMYGFSAATLL